MRAATRIVIADDHPIYVEGVRLLLSTKPDYVVVASAANSTELIELLGRAPCELLICDYAMPGGAFGDGLPLLGFIKRRFSRVRTIVMTGMLNSGILAAIRDIGVQGIVSKADELDELFGAIAWTNTHAPYLSPSAKRLLEQPVMPQAILTKREIEVVRLFAQGMNITQIASALMRSNKTVSAQKVSAMRKLGITSDIELVAYASRQGLVLASSHGGSPDADVSNSRAKR